VPNSAHFGPTIAGQRLSSEVMQSLRDAASKTGVDYEFLVAQASVESGFQGGAQARRSSAAGLFQFTGATWLRMMHDHGAKYGYADLARHLKPSANGGVTATDKETETRILDLRRDDRLSALFAGEYAKTNGTRLEAVTGHKATAAELHLAHLLGPNGAIRFLKAHEDNEKQAAAKVVPAAARQNPGLFYARGRTAKSVAAVYQKIQERLDVPLRQVSALETEELRPALGLSDTLPRQRTDRRA
jgi:Transglycosylase SLT domain